MKKVTCLLAALLLACGLSWAQTRSEVVAYTLDGSITGGSNGYATESVIDQGGITWMVTGNTTIDPWRIGGKNLAEVDRPMYSTNALPDNVTKVIVTNGTANLTVNSMTLIVSENADFSNPTSTISGTWAASDSTTFERPEDVDWTNMYYKLVYNVTETSGSNKYAQFIKANFYKEEGSVSAPSITASNVEIAYDATEGAIAYTINNGVEGGVLTAATEAEWLTIGTIGETVPFTCTVNPDGERTATVTLTYTYNTDQTVTKNVTVTQTTNPNAPGTEANPYTVAQARAAIDAGTGTQGVYATGIVSAIPTAYNSTFGNITFNMVDEVGDEVFLQAYRCGGDEAANVALGDVAVVYGNLTKYGSTYEFGQGCTLVSLTHPSVPTITITPATLNVDAQEHLVNYLDLAYENIDVENASSFTVHYYNAEGGEIQLVPGEAWMTAGVAKPNDVYQVLCTIIANEGEARTAYFKVSALDAENNTVYSNLVTVNQEAYVAPTYAELPFAFNSGRAAIEETDGLYQEGLGTDYNASTNPNTQLKFDGTGDWLLLQFNERPGTLTFAIKGNSFSGGTFKVQTSEDGTTYTDLATYSEFGSNVQNEEFTDLGENVRYIKWIYTNKDAGNVGLGNIALAEYVEPVIVPSITVTPAMVEVDAEEHEGTLTLAYENLEISDMTDFDIQYYDAEGEETETPDWIEVLVAEQDPEIGEGYVVSYFMLENEGEARSAYFKVYAMDDETNLVYSNLVTISQAAYVAPALDYATLPFEFNGGRSDIEGTDGLTAEGLGTDYNANTNPTTKLKFDGTGDWMILHFNEAPGTLTFDIKGNSFSGGTFTVQTSEDGETYEDLAAYTELGDVETKTFADLDENVRYIKWIYTQKSNGNVGLGNIYLYEMGGGPVLPASITVAPATVNATYEETEGTLTVTYENISDVVAEVNFCDAEGEAATYDWILADIDDENNVYYVIDANEGEARTAYLKVSALDDNTEIVYSNLVTINQEAYVAPIETEDYAVFTGDLIEGDYLIVYNGYAMNNVVTSGRLQYEEVEPENDVISTNNAAIVWHIARNDEGYWTIYSAAANAYAAGTGVKNKAQLLEDGTNDLALWTVEGLETFEFVNKGNSEANVNANLRNNGTYGFACYSTSIGGALTLYKKVTTTASYTLNITGYQGNEGGYYLIASPVYGLNPANVEGMLEGEFDLYAFDQAQNDQEWRNYKAGAFQYLSPGRGYLYAHYTDVELTFTGIPYEGDGKVALDYVEGVNLTGWNLIGNPFDEDYDISIGNDSDGYAETNFFVMNENGDDFELAERSVVHPMEGVLVEATAAGQFALFSNETGAWGGDPITKLNIRVSDENGKGDFARIRFGEGNNLEKFMLNPENTKIYFPVDGEEYAVVYTDNMGEMPLNFSAAADGTYTLNIHPEDMEMEYLHLIDNMTGMDVDLLANPTYSFEATTNDNAARFTLVFASLTGIEENSDNFAFFSNGNVIVSNEGNAMLQVVDMNGRIVKSENINGITSVSVEAAPGVYMLRLVNGDNMKVQKIVVR